MVCVGARPNFMKAAPILREMRAQGGFAPFLLHTGQHYDVEMSDAFFNDLDLPHPDAFLGVGSGSHAAQTALILKKFEKVLLGGRPDIVLVVGDVNSTLACSLTAVKMGIPVGHVEAGLRSGDMSMPEEINRILTDRISDLLFTTSPDADANLRREGTRRDRIYRVGNVMIDTLLRHREIARRSRILDILGLGQGSPYAVLTLHRPGNVDEQGTFAGILDALTRISREIPIVFPVHPRTARRIRAFGLGNRFIRFTARRSARPKAACGVLLFPPLGYLDFLHLMANARLVLTDSGGIQEETTVLGIPCLTLRENTERPITVTEGTNTVVGTDPSRIVREAAAILSGKGKTGGIPRLWDGRAASRIVQILKTRIPHPTNRHVRNLRSL